MEKRERKKSLLLRVGWEDESRAIEFASETMRSEIPRFVPLREP